MSSGVFRSMTIAALMLGIPHAGLTADSTAANKSGDAAERSAVNSHPASHTPTQWNLGDLYASPAAWRAAYVKAGQQIDDLARFKDQLSQGPETLNRALDAINQVEKTAVRLNVYASLKADENLRDSAAQERRGKADRLMSHYSEATGYVRPELTGMDQSTLKQWASLPVLSVHQHFLHDVIREAPHTLSPQTESALAALGPVNGQSDTFSLLSSADIQWPKVVIDGKPRTIDQAGYTRWRGDGDRQVRKAVFKAFWSTYSQYQDTFGSLLSQTVLQHVIDARLHHYDSALAAAVSSDDIPVGVYHQLITSVNDNLDTLYRYLKLRKRMLGVDTLHYYDIYPPLVKSDKRFTIDQARSLLRTATRPLGAHYQQLLDKATDSPWTSVYPSPGKSPGAYMAGAAYDVHPYVLMNFNGDYESVSTYAHEWGHGLHTLLADEKQPYATSDYPIFTAEVASTTNEELLVDHMIAQATTDQAKLYYIGQALESLRGTFFRQAQFAEFELAIHQAAANGESLSGERLTRMYGAILDKYYGVKQGITAIDPRDNIEWAYVPHFYYNFYVYQYATSITAGHYFASRIEKGDTHASKAYLEALSAGGSKSGYQLLRNAGVDLQTAAPYQNLIDYMNQLMDQADSILDKTSNHS
ncbi:MAG: oligoendopeptidase F [Salinisphaera sp.]|jgi:oligoendopeptidase F|nr:oligoendopeptidase F [Salinisphaera sp.]